MAFVPPKGLRRAVTAKTVGQIGQNNVMLGLTDRSLDPIMANQYSATVQRRTYAPGAAQVAAVKRAAANPPVDATISRTWQTPKAATSAEIAVTLRDGEELAVNMPRLDVLQSPLSEVENARRSIAQSISDEIESNMVTWFLGLTSKATFAPGDNGNAGSITTQALGKTGSIFIAPPNGYTKPATTGTGAADLVMDAIDDFVLYSKDENLVDGRAVYGDQLSTLYMVMPAILFKYFVVDQLRDKGYSLDPLTSSTLQRNAVFSTAAFTGSLGLPNLVIATPNSLPNAASGTAWQFWGGYTEAVAGGIGPVLSQMISPQENQSTDGWVVRQVMNPYYNLLNGKGIRKYTIAQK